MTVPTQKTALDLITGAMRKTGQYAAGEPISAADANDALDLLNALLDSMSNESAMSFNSYEIVTTLNPGQLSYTIGSGGQINAQRPMRITSAYSRITTSGNTIDFPCDIREVNDYTSIGLKSQPGPWAKWMYYNAGFPLGTIYLWPVPTQAVELHIWCDTLLSNLTLTTQLTLPYGYYNYLQFKLAEMLCVDYGVPISPDLLRMSRQFEAAIKSNNTTVDQQARLDAAVSARNGNDAGWFLTGGF